MRWRREVLAYFNCRLTNARTEGFAPAHSAPADHVLARRCAAPSKRWHDIDRLAQHVASKARRAFLMALVRGAQGALFQDGGALRRLIGRPREAGRRGRNELFRGQRTALAPVSFSLSRSRLPSGIWLHARDCRLGFAATGREDSQPRGGDARNSRDRVARVWVHARQACSGSKGKRKGNVVLFVGRWNANGRAQHRAARRASPGGQRPAIQDGVEDWNGNGRADRVVDHGRSASRPWKWGNKSTDWQSSLHCPSTVTKVFGSAGRPSPLLCPSSKINESNLLLRSSRPPRCRNWRQCLLLGQRHF